MHIQGKATCDKCGKEILWHYSFVERDRGDMSDYTDFLDDRVIYTGRDERGAPILEVPCPHCRYPHNHVLTAEEAAAIPEEAYS